jgi:hypothetical protein
MATAVSTGGFNLGAILFSTELPFSHEKHIWIHMGAPRRATFIYSRITTCGMRKEPSRLVTVRVPDGLYWRARRLMMDDPEHFPTTTSVILAALKAFLMEQEE